MENHAKVAQINPLRCQPSSGCVLESFPSYLFAEKLTLESKKIEGFCWCSGKKKSKNLSIVVHTTLFPHF
jgi:hypothetical protein